MFVPSRFGLLSVLVLLAQPPLLAADDAAAESTMEIAIAAPVVQAEISEGEELRRLFELYRDARTAGMLDEADVIAKQIVELSIETFGLDNKNTVNAISNLASLQMANDELDAAILNYSSAIGILERLEGKLAMDLFQPLRGMGSAQLQAGRPEVAKAFWERAVHISHVNLGPHNFEQIETVLSIARLVARDGKRSEINRMRRRLEFLYARDAERSFDQEGLITSDQPDEEVEAAAMVSTEKDD